MPTNPSYFQLPPAQHPVQSVPQNNTYQPDPSTNHIRDMEGIGNVPWFVETLPQEQMTGQGGFQDIGIGTPSSYSGTPATEEDETWYGGLWNDLWGWVGTEQGTAVLGGALDMAGGLWLADQKAGIAGGLPSGGNEGPSAAELQDARYAKHNVSINKPIEMGVRKFKR